MHILSFWRLRNNFNLDSSPPVGGWLYGTVVTRGQRELAAGVESLVADRRNAVQFTSVLAGRRCDATIDMLCFIPAQAELLTSALAHPGHLDAAPEEDGKRPSFPAGVKLSVENTGGLFTAQEHGTMLNMHLHLDMPSGIAGDMLLAALLDAGGDLPRLQTDLAKLALGRCDITARRVLVGGLSALQVTVEAPQQATWQIPHIAIDVRQGTTGESRSYPSTPRTPEPAAGHRPYRAIRELLAQVIGLPERAVSRAQAVFRLLAEAEAEVHGCDPETVEFHEVGAVDALVDVVGCCLLLEQLGITRIVASPLLPGHGTVQCAHGRMPVPVPAVARMLLRTLPASGVKPPWKSLSFESGELTTPTGCALVCALADTFREANAEPEALTVHAIGYGAGHKTIPRLVNVARVLICQEISITDPVDQVCELTCHIDDASGEHLAFAMQQLLAAGALDVVVVPALMKKGRPGHSFTVLTKPGDLQRIGDELLRVTPTIGFRHRLCQRRVLPRHHEIVNWKGHDIPCKVVSLPKGQTRAKPEDDAVQQAALATGISPPEIVRQVLNLRRTC